MAKGNIDVLILQQVTETKIRTGGLKRGVQQEIQIEVHRPDLIRCGSDFLNYVADYLQHSGRDILAGETFPYGYWVVKFQEANGFLDVWEYNTSGTDFVYGGAMTLTYWRDQHRICERYQALFTPPLGDKLTMVDTGVLEGLPVEGVRYPSPKHMSGWWITSDKYNGDVATLRREHTYHITAARPDLAPYLALPFGFRFDLHDRNGHVWFDEGVASETVS